VTLAASGAISLSDVLAEIRLVTPGRAATISLGDADVLALAGKSAMPVSLSDLYGKSSYVPMTVTPHSGISGNVSSSSSAGTASASPSVSVSNGSGGYTYAWSITSQSVTVTLSNATSATCNVSRNFPRYENAEFDVYLQCVVTDNTGHSVTVTGIEAYASWGTFA
jgi:hypothetical protein